MNLAIAAALVTAALEYPLSKRYPTTPPTGTLVRMAVAGVATMRPESGYGQLSK